MLLEGAHFPVLLHEVRRDFYEFQGFAYIHGIMYGELLDLGRCSKLPRRLFKLV